MPGQPPAPGTFVTEYARAVVVVLAGTFPGLQDSEVRDIVAGLIVKNDLGVLSQRDRDLLSQVRPGWF